MFCVFLYIKLDTLVIATINIGAVLFNESNNISPLEKLSFIRIYFRKSIHTHTPLSSSLINTTTTRYPRETTPAMTEQRERKIVAAAPKNSVSIPTLNMTMPESFASFRM